MVAIDNSFSVPQFGTTSHAGQFVLFTALCAALLAAASLVMSPDGAGWRTGAAMVSHFSLLIFAAAMVVEPLARLLPLQPLQVLAGERGGLMLAFAVAAFASLACLFAPSMLNAEHMSAPAVAYCGLTSLILVVLLFSSHPATIDLLGAPVWRALQRVATAYFWLAFFLVGIDHLVGPHRPDGWYGFSLLLLVGALLVRFADAFLIHLRMRGMTERTG